MKKIVLIASFVAAGIGAVNAQDSYKPAAGAKNLEVQFAPLGGSPISISGLRFRMFQEKSAIRVNFFLGYHSENKITQQANDTTKPPTLELKDSKSSLEFGIRPGYEMHFDGTDKLSPYWGGELDFGYKMNTDVTESSKAGKTGTDPNTLKTVTTSNKDGFIRIGFNLVLGFDYYIAKSLYLGAEMGLGFSYKMMADVTVKTEQTDPPTGFKDPNPAKQGGSMDFGPNVVSGIRLGYNF